MTEFVGQQIQSNQVQVIPLEKVVLSSRKPSCLFTHFRLASVSTAQIVLQFPLSCLTQKDCDHLAAEMRINPQQFKLNKESQKKMTESFQNKNKVSGGEKAKCLFGLFSGKENFNKEFPRHGSTSKEDLEKFYQESKDHVEWDGEKFVPKPLQLGKSIW